MFELVFCLLIIFLGWVYYNVVQKIGMQQKQENDEFILSLSKKNKCNVIKDPDNFQKYIAEMWKRYHTHHTQSKE